jgi:hypothetical protein
VQIILTALIEARLFTYKELGFIDLHPECTRVGTTRPDVVLITEKKSLAGYANRLADEFGVSLLVVEGSAQYISAEHFRDAYVQVTDAEITPIAYVDYDTAGWITGAAVGDMLEFYGLKLRCPVRYLVTGEVFTAEEKRLYARELPNTAKHHVTKNAKWLARSGGVDGKLLGMHSNHVQPSERVGELSVRALEGL